MQQTKEAKSRSICANDIFVVAETKGFWPTKVDHRDERRKQRHQQSLTRKESVSPRRSIVLRCSSLDRFHLLPPPRARLMRLVLSVCYWIASNGRNNRAPVDLARPQPIGSSGRSSSAQCVFINLLFGTLLLSCFSLSLPPSRFTISELEEATHILFWATFARLLLAPSTTMATLESKSNSNP